jgi:predicted nucleic acid-binding protein
VIVVSDATPLIALAKIGQLNLLQQFFGRILIPQRVYDEVVTDAGGRPGVAEIRQAEWIGIRSPEDKSRVSYLRADLDAGEAEALVLAVEVNADWILLDEAKARLAAEFLGLQFIGTLGVLLLAKRMGKLTAVRPLLEELRIRKFHISERVYQEILAQAGE